MRPLRQKKNRVPSAVEDRQQGPTALAYRGEEQAERRDKVHGRVKHGC